MSIDDHVVKIDEHFTQALALHATLLPEGKEDGETEPGEDK